MKPITVQKDGNEWIVVNYETLDVYGRYVNVEDATNMLKELISSEDNLTASQDDGKPYQMTLAEYKTISIDNQKDIDILSLLSTTELVFLLLDDNLDIEVKKTIVKFVRENRIEIIADDIKIDESKLIKDYLSKNDKEKVSVSVLEDMKTHVLISLIIDDNISINVKLAIYNEIISRLNPPDITDEGLSEEEKLELIRFNWGAFLMSGIWCLAYGAWGWFFAFIFINILAYTSNDTTINSIRIFAWIVLAILLGKKANRIAWDKKGKKFGSVYNTIKAQMKWFYWGIAIQSIIWGGLFFMLLYIFIVS